MQTCPSCDAHVGDDLTWCNQCYASLERAPTEAPAAGAVPLSLRVRPPSVETPPEFSRWRGGPTSFGPVGRVLLTMTVLALLAIGYPMLRGLMVAGVGFDVPGIGFASMYAIVAVPAGTYMLLRVWKRERVS